jgi:hypothetical protein
MAARRTIKKIKKAIDFTDFERYTLVISKKRA